MSVGILECCVCIFSYHHSRFYPSRKPFFKSHLLPTLLDTPLSIFSSFHSLYSKLHTQHASDKNQPQQVEFFHAAYIKKLNWTCTTRYIFLNKRISKFYFIRYFYQIPGHMELFVIINFFKAKAVVFTQVGYISISSLTTSLTVIILPLRWWKKNVTQILK